MAPTSRQENNYIRKRKAKAFLESLLYYIFRIFPIKKNRITVTTYEGRSGFCCNPKYIVMELHRRNPEVEFIWLVNAPDSKDFPDYIRKAKNDIWHRAYFLTTSRVWIDNYRKPLGTKKRKGQYYVNTWHGATAMKKIGLLRGDRFSKMAYLVSKNDSDMIDVVLTNSDWENEAFVRGLVYNGRFEKLGQAREDVLYGRNKKVTKKKVKQILDIPEDSSIALYAPTFREKNSETSRRVYSEKQQIDLHRTKKTLETKTGGRWTILKKLHPQLAENHDTENLHEGIYDVTEYEDIYELLAASDALITDYSTTSFEAGAAGIPVFLYMDDLSEYVKQRGGLCFRLNSSHRFVTDQGVTPGIKTELPFPVAENNDELEKNIMEFDKSVYETGCEKMMHDLGMIADGKAAQRAADIIIEQMSR